MPVYPYKCDHCKEVFEFEHRISDAPRKRCPKCKKLKLKRQIPERTSFSLIGDGWGASGYK